jgi:prepilin-type N-terminal cleavage/methylation domain-containing protein
MQDHSGKTHNNKGFTLVELLVGITIMGIIVIPFLHAFITGSRANDKAKRMLRGTVLTENLLEEFKPYNYDEIIEIFDKRDLVNTLNSLENADGFKEIVTSETDIYKKTYAIYGITEDNTKFDVQVTFDATGYYKKNETDPDLHNDEKTVNLSNIDMDSDVLLSVGLSDERRVYAEFLQRSEKFNGGISGFTEEDFKSLLTKEIIIDIEKSGTVVTINAIIKYTAPSGVVAEADRIYEKTMRLAEKNLTTEQLRNIYIMYFPNYSSVAASVKDNIVIQNREKVPCHVHIIKQVGSNSSNLLSNELFYVPRVSVTEMKDSSEQNIPPVTILHTNYGYNLGRKLMGLSDYTMPDNAVYSYNGLPADTSKDLLDIRDLLDEESAARLYKTEIQVYRDGAFDATHDSFDMSKYILKISNQ